MSTFDDIVTKIEDILKTTFELEDLSQIAQNLWTANPIAQLLLQSEEFENNLNEKPDVANVVFLIKIGFKNDDPASSRRKQYQHAHEVKDNITLTAINSPDKIARFVSHDGYTVDYDGTYSTIDYLITIRYRE